MELLWSWLRPPALALSCSPAPSKAGDSLNASCFQSSTLQFCPCSLDPSSWIWQGFAAWPRGSSSQHLPCLLAWRARVAIALHTIMQGLSTMNSPALGTGESHWTTGSIKSASPLEKHHKKPPTGLFCSCSFGPENNFLSKWTFSDRKRCLCPSHCLQNICTRCQCSRAGSIPLACAVTEEKVSPSRKKTLSSFLLHSINSALDLKTRRPHLPNKLSDCFRNLRARITWRMQAALANSLSHNNSIIPCIPTAGHQQQEMPSLCFGEKWNQVKHTSTRVGAGDKRKPELLWKVWSRREDWKQLAF